MSEKIQMLTKRDKKNQSSKKNYDKKKLLEQAILFEYYSVETLIKQNSELKFYHWSRVPHDILHQCGYINDYNAHRKKILQIYKDVPEDKYKNTIRDIGIDFIGVEIDRFIAGQCKLYNSKVSASDTNSWFSKIGVLKSKNISNSGMLCTVNGITTELWEDIQVQKLQHKNFSYIDFESWSKLYKKNEKNIKEINELDLIRRDYQKDTKKRSVELYKSNEICKLVIHMCCGLGKTIIVGDILKELAPHCAMFLAPQRTEVHNLFERIPKILHEGYKYLLFDIDGTTDINNLISTVEDCIKSNIKLALFITFKSAKDKICNILGYNIQNVENNNTENNDDYIIEDIDESDEIQINEQKNIFDESPSMYNKKVLDFLKSAFIVVDECHELSINSHGLNKLINNSTQTLFTTATLPKQFKSWFNFTHCINEYDFNYAIKNKLIVDYKIMIPISLTSEESLEDVVLVTKKVNIGIVQKASFLMKGMLQTGSRRCIVYCENKEDCKLFNEAWTILGKEYHGRSSIAYRINDDISHKDRKIIFDEFQSGEDNILKIITSCDCLNQSIDLPRCDSTFITCGLNKSSNIIIFIQRLLRASRIDPQNSSKLNHCFIWTQDINTLESVITRLKIKLKDDLFNKKIYMISQTYDNQKSKLVKEKIIEEQQIIEKKIVEWIDINKIWELKLDKANKFIANNKRAPKHTNINKEEYLIASWIDRQNKNYEKQTDSMRSKDRRKIWDNFKNKHKEYFKTNDEKWLIKLNIAELMILNTNKKPSHHSKDNKIKKIGIWINCQNTNYKKQRLSMKDPERRRLWQDFIHRHSEYFRTNDEEFDNTFNLLDKWFITNKYRPNKRSSNPNEKYLAKWIGTQNTNYKKQRESMKTIERRTQWDNFITKHKEYFLTIDELWENNLRILEEWIIKNKRKPNKRSHNILEKTIGTWINQQNRNYNIKKRSMYTIERRNIWIQFLEKYKNIFK